MTHNNITLNEQKLITENEILGKIVLEILLKHSTRVSSDWKRLGKTNEQIDELLSQPDWKEKSKFEAVVSSYDSSECIGHQWTDTWLVDAREPIEIIERLQQERETATRGKETAEEISEKRLEELTNKKVENEKQTLKIDVLEKDLKAKELFIEKQKEQIATAELDAETHYDFIGALQKLNGKVRDELHEEIKDKSETLRINRELLSEEKNKNKELQKKLEESLEMLEEVRKNLRGEKIKSRGYKNLLHLNTKSLPKTPKKLKVFKEKVKTKLQNLVEKTKHQSQELFARIEVRVK